MNEPVFILKGNVVYSKNKDELRILKDHYLISESGLVKGVFEKVPPEYAQVSVSDYGECLIIPGLTDLHVHAPQYTFRAMGMAGDEYVSGGGKISGSGVCPACISYLY